MSQQILANKYRPKSFAEVTGQEACVSILSRQVNTNTFKSSYLFAGPHGCGKTSVARIFTQSINHGEGEPIEIDAASNNGIDSIRALVSDAQQASLSCEYKTYIIDECHQLTRAAWDAALKLIEEPPANTVFIFCTTNPNKIPDTILSRVQRFDFKKVPYNTIADRLEFILNEEVNIPYEREALYRIAVKSNGFVRDAITELDKCISATDNLSVANVEKILGLIKYDSLFMLLKSLINKDINNTLNTYMNIKAQESNLLDVFDDILEFFIECCKVQKTNDINLSNIPDNYKDMFNDIHEDLLPLVERTFKYRTLSDKNNADSILNILFMEYCRR